MVKFCERMIFGDVFHESQVLKMCLVHWFCAFDLLIICTHGFSPEALEMLSSCLVTSINVALPLVNGPSIQGRERLKRGNSGSDGVESHVPVPDDPIFGNK